MTDRPIRALERTLGALSRLSRDGAQTLEQLTVATGYPRSSLLRLLRSLESVGAVTRDSVDRRYYARLRVVPLAEGEEALRRRVYAAVRDLIGTLGQTVELYRLERSAVMMIERHEPEGATAHVGARIGHPRPRDEIDAVVQVALASGDDDIAQPKSPYVINAEGRQALAKSEVATLVASVAAAGVASDVHINENKVRRHAVPIRHLDGRLAGVLAIAQMDHALDGASIRSALLAWAQRLNAVPNESPVQA